MPWWSFSEAFIAQMFETSLKLFVAAFAVKNLSGVTPAALIPTRGTFCKVCFLICVAMVRYFRLNFGPLRNSSEDFFCGEWIVLTHFNFQNISYEVFVLGECVYTFHHFHLIGRHQADFCILLFFI